MRVLSSSLALQAQSVHTVEETHREALHVWAGQRPSAAAPPPAAPAEPSAPGLLRAVQVTVSDGHSVEARTDARRLLVERLLVGHRIHTAEDAPEPTSTPAPASTPATLEAEVRDAQRAAQGNGFSMTYDRLDRVVETQGYAFEGRGVVTLADGRLLNVSVQVAQSRQVVQQRAVHLRAGQALQDPLVVNLGAGPATLGPATTHFDLNADGTPETLATLGAGQAFLARDVNGNGRIDDGRELFGPTSGSGFGELSALDGDGNGWVDEADAAWASLRVFRPDTGGTQTLAQAGVGALSTQAVATPFELPGGRVAQTALYLREDGSAGTVQHVDLEA